MTPERIVEFAEGLAGIAATGGGPKALAAYLAEATGCAVLVEDARWHHVAAAGSGELPASARPAVESGAPGRTLRVVAGSAHVGWLSLFDGTGAQARPAGRRDRRARATGRGGDRASNWRAKVHPGGGADVRFGSDCSAAPITTRPRLATTPPRTA